MAAYRLAWEPPAAMQEAYRERGHPLVTANPQTRLKVPIPATFVVDREQTIRARYVNADYTQRMEPADVLAEARRVAGK